MKIADIERVIRAAWDVALAPNPEAEQELVGVLRQTLHGADPTGIYQGNSVPEELAARRAEADEPYVPLRASPRVSKLIGENEAAFHE